MKVVQIVIAVILVLGAAITGSILGDRHVDSQPTCENAARRIVEFQGQTDDRGLGVVQYMTRNCREVGWSEDFKACVLALDDPDDLGKCPATTKHARYYCEEVVQAVRELGTRCRRPPRSVSLDGCEGVIRPKSMGLFDVKQCIKALRSTTCHEMEVATRACLDIFVR